MKKSLMWNKKLTTLWLLHFAEIIMISILLYFGKISETDTTISANLLGLISIGAVLIFMPLFIVGNCFIVYYIYKKVFI